MQKPRRAPLWRVLASVLTGALIASGAALGVAVPAQAADAPTVSVTQAPRAGGDVTVTGSGFSATEPGIYLGIRQDGATADAYTVWIGPSNTEGTIPGLGATAPLNPDGSFSVTAPVAAFAEGVSYSVVTRKAHGVQDPSQVTTTPIAYEAAPAAATTTVLSVTPADSATEGDSVTLTATVSPAADGAVEFFDGSASLGSAAVDAGVATTSTTTLAVGAHSLTAVFSPADAAAYVGSTSAAVDYSIDAKPVEPVFEPAIDVFLADGVTPYTGQPVYTDDVLVVKGSGFDPESNVGGRGVPIPNTLPQGAYVVLGSFLESWKPSTGATGSARAVVSQKWALAASVLDQVPSAYQGAIRGQWAELSADGSFSTTLTAQNFENALSEGAWGVYTYGAGGVTNADQELSVEINYLGAKPAEPTPSITVTPDTDLDPAVTNVLTVDGTGFTGAAAANGAYVLVGETSVWDGSGPLPSAGWIAQAWVQPGQITDGAFTTTLTVPAGTLDPAKSYQVATSAAHGLSQTDRSLDTFAPVTVAEQTVPSVEFPLGTSVQQGQTLTVTGSGFTPGDVVTAVAYSEPVTIGTATASAEGIVSFSWDVPATFAAGTHTIELSVDGTVVASGSFTVTAAPVASTPTITVSPSADLDPAVTNVLTVDGTGFTGAAAVNGAYVLFGETSVWDGSGPLPSAGWIAQAWVQPGQITDGAFTTTLTVPAGTLDPAKSYQVATSAAHGLSQTDRSLDTFAPVTVAQPTAPYVAFPLGSSVQQGQTLNVTGGGFAPGAVVTAVANSTPVTIGTATASAAGIVGFSWTVPAAFETGAHTLELSVDGAVVASAPFTVTAATVVPAEETPAAASCVAQAVSGASIQWGVKESFRNYINGPIANGSISGGWGSGSGAYSTETDRGRVSYGGSIHYTGHSGLLDLTLSNPRIQVNSATSASLILNVQSKGYNGSPDVNASGVVFATLSLPAASESSSSISWSNASATLTAAGAEAFAGFYTAGTALDPVSFSFPLGAEVPCDSTTDGNLAATGGTASLDGVWLGAGLLALGALLVVVRRRRLTV
ncbi:HtaA domain-containing protein [Microbacterium sp. 18062]|uniref:HtaA domain-containing protein n=1 Tax=Microbacterium sp. 18062 TaxID=2681410 RepID=UPI00135CB334|nr:HtaA domain-containing protein [Microbacterium sp. 18062]